MSHFLLHSFPCLWSARDHHPPIQKHTQTQASLEHSCTDILVQVLQKKKKNQWFQRLKFLGSAEMTMLLPEISPLAFSPWNIEVTLCLREHFHPDRGDTENSILSGRKISVLIYIREWHILPYFMKKQWCPHFPSCNRDKKSSISFICVLGQPVANGHIWNVVNSKYQARESWPKFSHWTYREFHITWK